jgi:DNA (cytosine-5)-methyltransferase 1
VRRPVLLDLFCCAGGASEGYRQAGFDVVGVDVAHQPNYRHAFFRGNALDLDLLRDISRVRRIDAIHASPPCQSFTAYRRKGNGVGDGYLNLIPQTRALLEHIGLPYVIENVPGAPLENPVQLCGSSFGLDVRRHRLFETNWPLTGKACDHAWQTPRFPAATNREPNSRCTVEVGVWRIPLDVQQRAMGIDWMELRELSEAIPPAYTHHIGQQLLAFIN